MFPTIWLLHETTEEYRNRKQSRGLCVTYRCRRRVTLAARSHGMYRCNTCNSRLYRIQHPDRYAYHNVRRSAQMRGIGFEWAFEDFQEFCATTGYLEMKGTTPDSLTIDRIRNYESYRVGNVRIMTHADNSSHKFENCPP